MTDTDNDLERARYHLEQFINHTEEEQRPDLLSEYDLYTNRPVPKEMADGHDAPEVETNGKFEEIAVNEAKKQGLEVVSVDTIPAGKEAPDVKKQVELKIRYEGSTASFQFVKERSDHVDIEPVTEEWYRRAIESVMRYNFEYNE